MIRLKVNRRSNVLLYAEMIIALLFFVISFAVIIRVFASADSLERRSAALCAQSIAEAYSVGGDVQKAVSLALGADLRDFTGSAEIGLDSGFYPADSSDVILRLDEQKQDTAAGVYSELAVEFFDNSGDDEELIYSLKCGAYVPGGGAVG